MLSISLNGKTLGAAARAACAALSSGPVGVRLSKPGFTEAALLPDGIVGLVPPPVEPLPEPVVPLPEPLVVGAAAGGVLGLILVVG